MTTKTYIGIDVGGTNIKIAWLTDDYKVLNVAQNNRKKLAFKVKTARFESFNDFVDFLEEFIAKNPYKHTLAGIGIGIPNGNYFTGKVEFAPNLNWGETIAVEATVKKRLRLPVKITNDANAIAYAEKFLGEGKNLSHFLVVTLGTGLGSGIVVNGEILYGSNGMAGELGHTIIIPGGRQCNCGNKGCLETYTSVKGVKQTFVEQGGNPNLSPFEITQAAKRNRDLIALKTYDITGKYLGMGLLNYIHLFSPQAIFFYGGLANAFPFFKNSIYRFLSEHLLQPFKNSLVLKLSSVDKDFGACYGAVAMIKDFLNKS